MWDEGAGRILPGRAAFAGEGVGGPAGRAGLPRQAGGGFTVKKRGELAGGESIQGAEAGCELDESQAALAVEPAEEIACGSLALLRVAFHTAGNEVAVGITAQLDTRHNMIEASHAGGDSAQTVKAEAALAGMNGLAKRPGLQEIRLLELDSLPRQAGAGLPVSAYRTGGRPTDVAASANLLGQAHLDQVTGFAAIDQA
ncbi:MAG TPA: hypothetical protein VFN26_04275 [Candidatus Acidoferrum sp.]|nr:hypothetical protein [Candidatus Acidoferrum sp.]